MYFYMKITLLYMLLCAIPAFGSINSPESVSIIWSQVVPDPAKVPNHNRLKLFHDILVEDDRHSLAFLRWNAVTEHHPTKCNVTIESRTFDGQIYKKICNIFPPPSDDSKWVFPEKVTYLNRDRILLTWREQHKTEGLRMTSQVIFMDTCQTSEYINIETYISLSLSIHIIVRHETTFDVIFLNGKICPISYYCQLTFNHDGKQLNRITNSLSASMPRESRTLMIIHSYAMNYHSGKGIVLVGNKGVSGLEVPEVYSPIIGWTSTDGLFYKNHWYSNSSGFATICWQLYNSTVFRCKWLDGTHRNQVLTLNMRRQYIRISGVYNKPDGRILLLMSGYNDGTKIFVDEAQNDGRCKRLAEIPYNHGLLKRVEMSIRDRKTCFSFITKNTLGVNLSTYPIIDTYRFTTKCILNLYDGTHEFITCGQNYL